MGYRPFVKPLEDDPPPLESENPTALAGAIGLAESENEITPKAYTRDPRLSTLRRRFGLAAPLADDLARLAWGAR